MADWSPSSGPYRISDPASPSQRLERSYRRLVACYPRSFRSENTEEIIAVLLATAREDQYRPSLAEAADLLRGALRMRAGLSRCPRTVLYAVRLMYLGAVAQIVALVMLLLSRGALESTARYRALRALGASHGHAVTQQVLAGASTVVSTELTADVVIALLAIALWLLLAWASGKGLEWARPAAVIVCLFYLAATTLELVNGDMRYVPGAAIAGLAVAGIGVAANVALVMRPSWPYYDRQAIAR
jgi:hypothetical protein